MRRRPVAAVLLAVVATALGGCASAAGGPAPAKAAPAGPIPLATSMTTPGVSWAVLQTGGRGTGGKFWQLLVRPAGSSSWRLATPPGVADNGGLVVTGTAAGSLTAGFLPNALLKFTPLATTTDAGAHWTQGLLPAGLTAAPSALAALPEQRLVAITAKGALESAAGGKDWSTLATLHALAATTAGRACGLTRLTAVAASPSGTPVLAGDCSRPGEAGVFWQTAAGWQIAAPMHDAKLTYRVLGLVSARGQTSVLLAAGSGTRLQVIPALLASHGTALTTLDPLSAGIGNLTGTFFSSAGGWGAVFGGRQVRSLLGVQGQGDSFTVRAHLKLPGPDATVVMGSGLAAPSLTALVPGLDTVAVWQLDKGTWHRTQVIGVPTAG